MLLGGRRLDELRDRFQSHRFAHLTDRGNNCIANRVADGIPDELAVDLQIAEGQDAQIRERAQACAKIIEGEKAAVLLERPHEMCCTVDVQDRCCLGYLETNRSWCDSRSLELTNDEIEKTIVAQRLA
jgi:hypothetical protein